MQGRQQILQHLAAIKLEMIAAAFHTLPTVQSTQRKKPDLEQIFTLRFL